MAPLRRSELPQQEHPGNQKHRGANKKETDERPGTGALPEFLLAGLSSVVPSHDGILSWSIVKPTQALGMGGTTVRG